MKFGHIQRRSCLEMLVDGRRSHWYTFSSTMSFRLRLAFNQRSHAEIQRRVAEGPPLTLKNRINIGFISNTGPEPLKNHKVT